MAAIACNPDRTDDGGFGTASESMASASGPASEGGPEGPGDGEPGESGLAGTTEDAADTNADSLGTEGQGSTGSMTGVGSDGGDGGPKFDTPSESGGATAEGGDSGDCGCGNMDWSYVWVANSGESTVSKINTRTMVEEGRYVTRPDKAGNPSRTSVSIDGKAVAVANRNTGIVKIWTLPELCSDKNGTPGIQTSSSGFDVLPWGMDDCVAWYADFSSYMSVQRPVQWTPGVGPCHTDQKIWTTTCDSSGVSAHRLNGDTGVVEDTIPIANQAAFPCTSYGPYGGAVDYEGNFWTHGLGSGKLARVDFATLDVEIFDGGGYGITVDTKARVWFSGGISRFDYSTKQWEYQNVSDQGGLAQDLQNRIWAADGMGNLVWVDMETLAVGGTVSLPLVGFSKPTMKGVSVDIDGNIWAVPYGFDAHKIDPNTFAITTFSGLNLAYTYSDMTGGALANVTCNPPAE